MGDLIWRRGNNERGGGEGHPAMGKNSQSVWLSVPFKLKQESGQGRGWGQEG